MVEDFAMNNSPASPVSPGAFGVTPLGLAIARKQLEGDSNVDKEQIKKSQQRKQKKKKASAATRTKKNVDGNSVIKNPSWTALVEGLTLYVLCTYVPSFLEMMVYLDREYLWNEVQYKICQKSAWICLNAFGAVLRDESDKPEPLDFSNNFAPDTYLMDICVIVFLTITMALIRVLVVHSLVPNNLAPQQMEALVRCKSIHLLSKEYHKTLTPRSDHQRRVISWDSLNKEFGPGSKDSLQLPPLPLMPDAANDSEDAPPLGFEPLLGKPRGMRKTAGSEFNLNNKEEDQVSRSTLKRPLSNNDLGLSVDTPVDTHVQLRPTITNLPVVEMGGFIPTPRDRGLDDNSDQHLLVDDSEDDAMIPEGPVVPPRLSPVPFLDAGESDVAAGGGGWKRRGSTASLAAAAAAAVQEEEDHEVPNATAAGDRGQTKTKPQRLFAAPRYATAVFRWLYCTVSCAMAWFLFRDADFWPSYVGGHGSTTRCWDLSGTLSLANDLDSDFDHRNTVLRRFFLVQASYHLHSGAFHIFSVVLLYFLKKEGDGAGGKRDGWLSLLLSLFSPRAMVQHTLSLLFLSVSYVFSSLRRLGAIGMFALDMSSWSLHLLQTCLNAPSDSILSKPKVIKGVWALVVLPSFLYFRFAVWPLVGYSAMAESGQWLAQLESTLVPGSALWFRRIFQLWMLLWMGFHGVHFKRLVFHPHIQRTMVGDRETGRTPS